MSHRLLRSLRAVLARYRRPRGPLSDHFDGTHFFNPWDRTERTFLDLLKWRFTGESTPWPRSVPDAPRDTPPERVHGDSLRVSFIGHSITLIQTAGLNILTDPVFSKRAGPLGILGPRRTRPPGIALEALPPIDAALVTHNHYDHMDLPALAALHERHAPRILTPPGNAAPILKEAPGADACELDWWQCADFGEGRRVHAVPASHWSARGLFDRRGALWCSFVVETPGGNVYFCGDTGYGGGVVFRQARERFGGFRLALLPIGAYEPRWFMAPAHMNPEEAVQAMLDLNAGRAAAIHHGVFKLSDEGIDQPLIDLAAALDRLGVAPGDFPAPAPGEALDVPDGGTASRPG